MRYRWTSKEHKVIVDMFRDGAPLQKIADALGRPERLIGPQIQYLRSLGVDLPLRYGKINVDELNASTARIKKIDAFIKTLGGDEPAEPPVDPAPPSGTM